MKAVRKAIFSTNYLEWFLFQFKSPTANYSRQDTIKTTKSAKSRLEKSAPQKLKKISFHTDKQHQCKRFLSDIHRLIVFLLFFVAAALISTLFRENLRAHFPSVVTIFCVTQAKLVGENCTDFVIPFVCTAFVSFYLLEIIVGNTAHQKCPNLEQIFVILALNPFLKSFSDNREKVTSSFFRPPKWPLEGGWKWPPRSKPSLMTTILCVDVCILMTQYTNTNVEGATIFPFSVSFVFVCEVLSNSLSFTLFHCGTHFPDAVSRLGEKMSDSRHAVRELSRVRFSFVFICEREISFSMRKNVHTRTDGLNVPYGRLENSVCFLESTILTLVLPDFCGNFSWSVV